MITYPHLIAERQVQHRIYIEEVASQRDSGVLKSVIVIGIPKTRGG